MHSRDIMEIIRKCLSSRFMRWHSVCCLYINKNNNIVNNIIIIVCLFTLFRNSSHLYFRYELENAIIGLHIDSSR